MCDATMLRVSDYRVTDLVSTEPLTCPKNRFSPDRRHCLAARRIPSDVSYARNSAIEPYVRVGEVRYEEGRIVPSP